MTDSLRPRIDAPRLMADLEAMAAIGATPAGGCFRPALSDADAAARALFRQMAQAEGLALRVDAVGNMFARREGEDPEAAPVMIGSHLDTQTPGGRFDGVMGVLAGLAVARALNAAGARTRRALEIVNWTNEEGARFQPGVMGSAVWTGALAPQTALEAADPMGATLGAELARTGWAGAAPVGGPAPHRYLELHIEQGPELEAEGLSIGAVTGSSWIASGFIDVHGENGHAQTMPMSRRRNALAAAAELILAIEAIGAAQEPEGMVSATVVTNAPNNRVNIPHLTLLSYTMVHATEAGREAIAARIIAAAEEISARRGLEIAVAHRHHRAAVAFPAALQDLTLEIAAGLGLKAKRMGTLTAHDALPLSQICPTALIFTPCVAGLSHCEAEECRPEWVEAGAQVLLGHALAALD